METGTAAPGRAWLASSVVASIVGLAGTALADGDASSANVEEARRLYGEAHAYFVAGRCADAMPLLVRASGLVPSPNSGLLIARCLASDGKRVEAVERFASAERDALNLVRSGETRYAETAAAAAKEGADLRSRLGSIRVKVGAHAGVAVEVDGVPTEVEPEGQARVFHEPGAAKVAFVLPSKRSEKIVAIVAGKEIAVSYDAPPPPAPVASSRELPWTFFAAGGIAVAGLGTFTGFGLASESTYGGLHDRCGSRCLPADQAEADRGRTFQTIANVGLVVGLVFAATAAIVLVTR